MRHSGVKIRYVPAAAVEHPVPAASRPLIPGEPLGGQESSAASILARRPLPRSSAIAEAHPVCDSLPISWEIDQHRQLEAAAMVYAGEFVLALFRLPFWLRKYGAAPRSPLPGPPRPPRKGSAAFWSLALSCAFPSSFPPSGARSFLPTRCEASPSKRPADQIVLAHSRRRRPKPSWPPQTTQWKPPS